MTMVSDEQAIALGRRLRAGKHWRWLPGMLVLREDGAYSRRLTESIWAKDMEGHVPDIRDAATAGCVLALLRGVCSHADVYPEGSIWCWHLGEGDEDTPGTEATEADAIVAAWDAMEGDKNPPWCTSPELCEYWWDATVSAGSFCTQPNRGPGDTGKVCGYFRHEKVNDD